MRSGLTKLIRDEYAENPLFSTAAKVVLGATLLVIIVAIIWESMGLPPQLMSLYNEESLPNRFAQGLMILSVFMFLVGYARHNTRAFLALAFLYAFVWFDDTMMYHEHVGAFLDSHGLVQARGGMRAQDIGELIGWGLAAIPMALVFLWAWMGRRAGDFGMLVVFGCCFGLLVFCGVVVDMLHIAMGGAEAMDIGWIEDGGEIFSVALACVFSVLFSTMKTERWFMASARAAAQHTHQDTRHALSF
ncbi:hypothetical protein [Larsenimonas rhizosphaerae]|uniref:hypothetical protein n=1 Tax=Larsenimonas rhizosphaerae TaxID=2944682 RepID=UPI0020337898|nr:hypothetical protein [Larsenimonas rhizosphaerae]MCM2131365.1 hypothetical protein [Larsenimonas rhizosphaerae]